MLDATVVRRLFSRADCQASDCWCAEREAIEVWMAKSNSSPITGAAAEGVLLNAARVPSSYAPCMARHASRRVCSIILLM
jgi:hypothetical protein